MPPILDNPTTALILKHFPKWILGFGLMAYATGFLTLYTFFRRGFDITDIGADIFKPQYIHVGLLYFGLVLLVTLPLFILTFRKIPAINVPAVLIAFNVLLVFYLFVIFTPPGFASRGANWGLLSAVLFLTLAALSGVRAIVDCYSKDPKRNALWKTRLRWGCLLFLFLIDVVLFADTATDLFDMMWYGGFFFIVIVLIGAFFASRLVVALKRPDLVQVRTAISVVGAGIIGAFYYLSVLSFALFIFPCIPDVKGGGDFRYGADVRIVFRTDADLNGLLPFIGHECDSKMSKRLKLIHETSTNVFVADPSQTLGPDNWVRHTRGIKRPTVLSINKMFINTIVFVEN